MEDAVPTRRATIIIIDLGGKKHACSRLTWTGLLGVFGQVGNLSYGRVG